MINFKKNKDKIKRYNIISLLIILICLITFISSCKHILSWYNDTKKTNNLINNIINNTEIIEIKETNEINKEELNNNENTNLINVDLKELKLINQDTTAWLYVNGTSINYPVVQYHNNHYYLNHSFDKSYNEAGWIFLDYRNNLNKLDQNTIIYAHGRVGNKMFGSLRTILESDWYLNKKNYYIKLSTSNINILFEVFSLYKIKNTNDYLQINFSNKQDYLEFLNKIKKRSFYSFKITPNQNDNIITLSTCYNQNYKIVMHAKLIKKESFN